MKIDREKVDSFYLQFKDKSNEWIKAVYFDKSKEDLGKEVVVALEKIAAERKVDVDFFFHMAPMEVEEEKISDEKVYIGNSRNEQGGCLRVFLIVSGLIVILKGIFGIISKDINFSLRVTFILMLFYGSAMLFAGFKLKMVVMKYPKLIYTFVITEIGTTILALLLKFDFYFSETEIVINEINIIIGWIVVSTMFNLRESIIKQRGEPEAETDLNKYSVKRKKINKIFFGLILGVLLLGVMRIGVFPTDPLKKAIGYLLSNDAGSAILELKKALKKDPDNKDLLMLLTNCYVVKKDTENILSMTETLKKKYNDNISIKLFVAEINNLILGKYNNTVSLLKDMERSGKFQYKISRKFERDYYYLRGYAFYRLNYRLEAIRDLKKAIELEKEIPDTSVIKYGEGNKVKDFYRGIYMILQRKFFYATDCLERVLKDSHNLIYKKAAKIELENIKKHELN